MGVTIGIINGSMIGHHAEPGEPDWDRPDVHAASYWQSALGRTVEEYAEIAPHMIVWVLTEDEADELGYDWQDDAIGAMR